MPYFELTTPIAAPPERVFYACLDVEVHTASMADSGERAVGKAGGNLELGDLVTFKARHLGVRWTMAARISAYHRPERFIDKQEHGPFKRWHHAHYFTPDGGDGTVMRDVVDFAAPLGPLGALAEGLVLRRYMINLIERRNQYIKIFLETS